MFDVCYFNREKICTHDCEDCVNTKLYKCECCGRKVTALMINIMGDGKLLCDGCELDYFVMSDE